MSFHEGVLNVRFNLAGSALELSVFAFVGNAQLEEALVTPSRAPGVLDQPVTCAVFIVVCLSVAHYSNCVVH